MVSCGEKKNPDDNIDVPKVDRITVLEKPTTETKTVYPDQEKNYLNNFSKGVESIVVYQYTGTGVNRFVLDKSPTIDGQWVIIWINGKKHWLTGNIEIIETAIQ